MGSTSELLPTKRAWGFWLARLLLRIVAFVLVVEVWMWVGKRSFGARGSLVIILGGPIAALPFVWLARLMLDAKPDVRQASRVTTALHYGLMVLLGSAVVQAFKLAETSPGWGIPMPAAASSALLAITGVLTLLTVLNLALHGLGAPFGIALSRRLAVGWMYAWTRNPMVVCTLAFLVSLGLRLRSLWFVLWVAVVLLPVMLAFVKVYEERELEIRFGKPYLEYKAKTPMLWPRKPKA